jgi:uroporphyrinogen-III synthase
MATVLVTRPEPGASKTAQRLVALGFDVQKLPLTKIVSLPFDVPSTSFDAVIVTSPQALHDLPASLLGLPLYAVGQTSAAAARLTGFETVIAGGGDATHLIEIIRTILPASTRLLYLCGKVRRPDLEDALSDYALTAIETYDTQIIDHAALDLPPLDLVMLTSVQSASQMSKLAVRPDLKSSFKSTHYLCLSQRIADGLTGVKPSHIHVTLKPDEESLLILATQIGN